MKKNPINELISQVIKDGHSKTAPTALTGNQLLPLDQIINVANHSSSVELKPSPDSLSRNQTIIAKMHNQINSGTSIYGVTSAYGGQAKKLLFNLKKNHVYEKAKSLSQSIIHVDVSTGPTIPTNITRAAMLIRANMLIPGYSAVRLETISKIVDLLNHELTPQVGFYGTLGASGDLAHNGRVLSTLLQLPSAQVLNAQNQILPANVALPQAGLSPLVLEPKEGLGLVNGDNFSTAACLIQTHESVKLMLLNEHISAINIQALLGSNRNFHPLLETLRPHPGQAYAAQSLRQLLEGSRLSPQELTHLQTRKEGELIQDAYSTRCLPQYYGADWETLTQIWKTLKINANSVSDNPLWTTPETSIEGEDPYQWVSGGNFLAMHMSDALDKLRKILIHMVKQNDRHVNRLVNPDLNNNLPPNLSDKNDFSLCTFKGLQTQMGMYEVYASSLATPISTAFGIHEQLNQDLTSHAMTSALYNQEVLRLTKLSLASSLIAGCQAIDLRGGPKLLSPATQPLYYWLRSHVPYIASPQPLGHLIETIATDLYNYDFKPSPNNNHETNSTQ